MPFTSPSASLIRAGALVVLLLFAGEARRAVAGDLPGWKTIRENGGVVELTLDPVSPPDEQHTNSWRLTAKNSSGRAGIVSGEIDGESFRPGQWLDFTFKARTEGRPTFALTVSLESADGKKVCARATIPEVGHQWASYALALNVRQISPKCRLVITMEEPGTIWLSDLALTPRNTKP